MVRIRRREPGGHERRPDGQWPDGRDPLPGVIDVEALGPLRRPVSAPAAVEPPTEEHVAELEPEPDIEEAPELEDAELAEPEPSEPQVGEPDDADDPWLALPQDMWDVPAQDPHRQLVEEPIEPEPDEVAPVPPPRRDVSLASAALVMAFVVLLTGVLSAATGLADDDEDVATAETTTTTEGGSTTSTSAFVATLPTAPTTGTTSVPSSGEPPPTTVGPRITIPSRTPTTRPPSTEPTQPGETTTSTSEARINRAMTTEITFEPAAPVAGQNVRVTIVWTDPDAVPTTNCMEVRGDDGIAFPPSECDDDECAVDPSIPPQGGTRTFVFDHVFASEGEYEITATGRSGVPECGNFYASSSEASASILVDLAS